MCVCERVSVQPGGSAGRRWLLSLVREEGCESGSRRRRRRGCSGQQCSNVRVPGPLYPLTSHCRPQELWLHRFTVIFAILDIATEKR